MEKCCRTCHHFNFGVCYCEDFVSNFSSLGINNYQVAESGVLRERLEEVLESYLNGHEDEYSLETFLKENYKMGDKRISEIVENEKREVKEFIKITLLDEILDNVSSTYESYEEGEIPNCKPPRTNDEGIEIDDYSNFYCKYYE